jgi:5-methylcytosine-specific restriction endonuclease McrA
MGVNRPGRWALRDPRWPALRLQALRRDGFRCVQCGARGRLEVDHIERVDKRPDLAFELSNTQSLCGTCHNAKTRRELGQSPPDPERKKWRRLLAKGTI